MDNFEEFIIKKYPNRSPKVLLQKFQDTDGTWFYGVKEVQDQSEAWQSRQAEVDQLIAENIHFRDKKWDENEAYNSGKASMFALIQEKDKRIEELENRLNVVNLLLINWGDEYTQNTTSHESIADAVLRTCATELKQALRGDNA